MTQAEAERGWRAFDVRLDEQTGVATVTLTGTAAGNAMGGLVCQIGIQPYRCHRHRHLLDLTFVYIHIILYVYIGQGWAGLC